MPRKPKAESIEDDGEELTPESITKHLVKNHGEGAASQGKIVVARDYISTQCAGLNYAIGRSGVPVGRITNIYGQEGSAKSTLAYHLLAETQHRGGIAVLYDSEGAYDFDRGKRLGIDFSKLVLIEAPHMEQAFDEFIDVLQKARAKPGKLICAVWDSVAATPTKARLEGKSEDIRPGEQARIISAQMPQLNDLVVHTNCALVLVNQLRNKIRMGGMPVYSEESLFTQSGEQSIKFYSSLRINLRMAGKIGDKDEPEGIEVAANIVKNKVAPPFKKVRFPMMFWDGIDNTTSMLDVAERTGLVSRNASWYVYGDEKFQSSKFGSILAAHPELGEQIVKAPEKWIEEYEDGD